MHIIHKHDAKKSFLVELPSGICHLPWWTGGMGPASNDWHLGTCCRIPSSSRPQRLSWFWLNLKQKDGTWTLGWMCDVYQTMCWYFFAEMRNIYRKMRNIKTRTTSGIGRVWHFLNGTLICWYILHLLQGAPNEIVAYRSHIGPPSLPRPRKRNWRRNVARVPGILSLSASPPRSIWWGKWSCNFETPHFFGWFGCSKSMAIWRDFHEFPEK